MRRHQTRTGDATTSRRLASLGVRAAVDDHRRRAAPDAGPPAPTETVRELSWSRIALPESVAASSLAATSEALLVGGRASSGGDHPVLFVVDASGVAAPVPLHPNSPYAKVADLVSVAARGDEVVALGAAHGGAHANFRWTVWAGSRQRLDEYRRLRDLRWAERGRSSRHCDHLRGPASRAPGPPAKAARRSGMASTRPEVAPPGICWHGARQYQQLQVASPRRKRRRLGHDHLRLGDHLR